MGKRVVLVAVVVALAGAVAPSHGAVLPAVGKITGGALYSCFPNDKPVDTRPFRIEYEGRIQHAGHTYTVTHGVGVGGDTCSLGRSLQEGSVLMNLTSETASGTFIAYCAGRLA